MLYHVTARHSSEQCAMYNEQVRNAMQEFTPTITARCEELGVKVHFAVNGAPDHVFYLLVETDDYTALCQLLGSVPMKQDFDIRPVRPLNFEQV